MKIKKVHIQNYKSIVDSEEVEVDNLLTIIVGKNEQGKSNFLKALRSFNPDYKYMPADLPNHVLPSFNESLAKETPIVTLYFSLEPKDIEKLKSIIKDIANVKHLKVSKYYNNEYKFNIIDSKDKENSLIFTPPDINEQINKMKQAVADFKTKFSEHAKRLPEFAKNTDRFESLIGNFLNAKFNDTDQIENLVKTFCTGLRGLSSQDQAIQNDIVSLTQSMESGLAEINKILSSEDTNRTEVLKKQLPIFILHSSIVDKIPNEVDIAQFTTDPNKTSLGMLNLCRAAGLSVQKIKELSPLGTSQRESHEDHYKTLISGAINDFWTQENYQVHFRIDTQKLSVSISDDTYSPRIPPSQRSEGFQWLLSFYCTIQNECASLRTVVILLDNPALELHVDGQRDIKRLLEEKIAPNAQVIYVTHSPALVDPFKLNQIRVARLLRENRGTKITDKLIKEGDDFDLLEPLRTAIGSNIGYSLLASNHNILVEGTADKFLMEGILHRTLGEQAEKIFVNGSLAESKDCQIANIYKGLGLPFINVVDADSDGRRIAEALKSIGMKESDVINIGDVFSEKEGDFTLADIFSEEVYFEAVKLAYPEKSRDLNDKPEKTGSKIELVYEKKFKEDYNIGFSKTRVAQCLKKMLIERKRLDKNTEKNLEKLVEIVRKSFNIEKK